MKLPETIICNSPEVTLAIAHYLENNHGIELDSNLIRSNCNPATDYFFGEGEQNEIRVHNDRASWNNQHLASVSRKGFSTLKEFVASISTPSWKVGCRTIVVDEGELLVKEDNIRISKSTLEEMLAALK